MTDEEVLNKIFNKGDLNGNYTDITGGELCTAQLIEPTLAVTQMTIRDIDHIMPSNYPERMSFRIPLISINEYRVKQTSIINFNVDYSPFLPTMMVEFMDYENCFLSTAFPKEGSTIQLYIGGLGDELYYKPIRQDFIITNITSTGNPGASQTTGGPLKYRVTGTLSVPAGARKESWSDTKVNSRQALFNLAVYTGLGFATNFTKENDVDAMQWTNVQSRTLLDFMKDIARHACYSQYSFFTAFVDQYYVFNFIECHSLLSHGGEKTDTPAMIYSNIQQSNRPAKEPPDNSEKKTENEIVITKKTNNDSDDPTLFNTEQKVSYYFISNNEFFSGWSNYIESYHEINNGSTSINDGYRVHLSYVDENVGEWGCNNCEFVLAPIDNLKREGPGQQIAELPDTVSKESYIPLNLAQTTNHVYLDTDMGSPDNIASMESFISGGMVDTTNTFKLYHFAQMQNDYQMRCLKKCGLKVRLQNYNPAITKFSRIWVDIFDKNPISISNLREREIRPQWRDEYKDAVKERNSDIIYYPEENGDDGNNEKNERRDPIGGVFNRSLSGWYVVTEMRIVFNRKIKNLQTELTLNRIEYKPVLKSEYDLAKRAINEKYRYDNTTGSWFNNMDDYSYSAPDTGETVSENSAPAPENNSNPPAAAQTGTTQQPATQTGPSGVGGDNKVG